MTRQRVEPLTWFPANAFEEFRVTSNVIDPELLHDPLHVLGVKATPMRRAATELAQSHNSGIWVRRVRRKCRIGRLMHDALGRNIELVSPD
ncbi:hypothetical protein CQ10_33815 [Bradyrhizobium valentinum]|uniref:Uncharacterized protein n=1 Tax=Bradyrhizobium valentinum TaxID=1518501 RepID=A0A0R3L014_9BRAD|nr:hypothetical protein CQ10_33815 [Bradyrhizobium valentinum]KRR00350.1 hypothetical protein CP49_27780 [Bradyrhizobium valentinum]